MKGEIQFVPSGFFVARTPLYPFDEFSRFSKDLTAAAALEDCSGLERAYDSDYLVLRGRIREFAARSEVQDALWVGTPQLIERFTYLHGDQDPKKASRLERTLYRYFSRMTARATPFGLFAGCSVGYIGKQTRLRLGSRESYWRRSRLDMEYLCSLSEVAAADSELRRKLRFSPNASLCSVGGRLHYSRSTSENGCRAYDLVSVDQTSYLFLTLEQAARGSELEELALALAHSDSEIDIDEAREYITQLIDSQILVSEIALTVSGPDPLEDLVRHLACRAESSKFFDLLTDIKNQLQQLDHVGVGSGLEHYEKIRKTVSALTVPFNAEHLLQTDLFKPAPDSLLGEELVDEILEAVQILASLQESKKETTLTKFAREFQERYQEQEVPFIQALDDEIGIGFERSNGPSANLEPLLRGMHPGADARSTPMIWKPRDAFLLRKLETIWREGTIELRLEEADLRVLRASAPLPLPDAFSVTAILGERRQHSEQRPDYLIHVAGGSGPSGAVMLGRFCDADETLLGCVRQHIQSEEELKADQNVVFAEVVHLPEGRLGNVIFRPSLRRYEIPFLAPSRLAEEFQIPITDLLISIHEGRIILRSKRLGCEVIPRLTNAHSYNADRNVKAYKFLCLLQTQGTAPPSWDWGGLQHASFLPRVTFGRTVLARARWRVTKPRLDVFAKERNAGRFRRVKEWQKEANVPRFAVLVETDNELLIDFDNVLAVDTFVEYARKKPEVIFKELFPSPEGLCMSGPEGMFVHQLVIPFVRRSQPKTDSSGVIPSDADIAIQNQKRGTISSATPIWVNRHADKERIFLPGSEWLFAKLYASPYHVDWLLTNLVKPLVEKFLVQGDIDKWFFVRYGDPQWHLRLRLHGASSQLSNEVLPALKELVERETQNGRIWRFQIDTYEREVERYGGTQGVSLAEEFFFRDSEAALEVLSNLHGGADLETRWKTALYGVDALLSDLGFDLKAKHQFASKMRALVERDPAFNPLLDKEISVRYRRERRLLESILNLSSDLPDLPHQLIAAFERRTHSVVRALQLVQEMGELGRSQHNLSDLAQSYIHMHLNRILRSSHRLQELVIYNFLARLYESKLARSDKTAASAAS